MNVGEVGQLLEVLVQEIRVGPEGNQDPTDDDSKGSTQVQNLPTRYFALQLLRIK